MATITIRGIDDETKAQLRLRAAGNGRSMEAEVRAILGQTLFGVLPSKALGSRIRQRFVEVTDQVGGPDESQELDLPARSELARPADLE
jgi:plasmid stability protein